MTCRLAQPGEISRALRLVLSPGAAEASDEQVVDFMRYALARGIETSQIFVAAQGERIHSAVLPIPSAGRTLLLLSSARGAHESDAFLLEHVLEIHAGRGVHLAQVLLDPADEGSIEFYAGRRFERLAELLYLQTTVRRSTRAPLPPDGCAFLTYSDHRHALFARTIAATYEGSVDCPALAGRRHIEDIVAGHRATGEFDPSLWHVLVDDRGKSLGVVLAAPAPPTDSMELVYLGLTPPARGRDLGDLLLRQAFFATRQRGLPKLTLAVDAANTPALKLYYRHGMRRVQSRIAMMRELTGVLHEASTRAR